MIPVIPIVPEREIASRPRRQSVFDTEAYNDAVAAPSKITLFRSTTRFQEANVSLDPKVYGRDTNLDGPGGALGKGQVLHWYSIICPFFLRGADLTTLANVIIFEEIARLREMSWFTFYWGKTNAYITCQLEEIPQGVGCYDVRTTHDNAVVFPISNGRHVKQNAYDVTFYGEPTVITDNETFSVDIEKTTAAPAAISPTAETFVQVHLQGIYLLGIRG